MAPFRLQATSRRHQMALATYRPSAPSRAIASHELPNVDPRAGQLARGLMYGLPLGLLMWLLLALLLWRIL